MQRHLVVEFPLERLIVPYSRSDFVCVCKLGVKGGRKCLAEHAAGCWLMVLDAWVGVFIFSLTNATEWLRNTMAT